jgi:hypothetical protein
VSPKNSSLAYDDLKEEAISEILPELNLIVNRQYWIDNSLNEIANAMVSISGRITVSF